MRGTVKFNYAKKLDLMKLKAETLTDQTANATRFHYTKEDLISIYIKGHL